METHPIADQSAHQSQILRFLLGPEEYAFDVLKVREILTLPKITPLPSSLDFFSGVINLRGSVIPVVDLRKKFRIADTENTIDTSIIIVEVVTPEETTVIGAVVDSVKGVLHCDDQDLSPPPRFGMRLNTGLIRAIAKKDSRFIVILDADKVFSDEELGLIKAGTEAPPEESPSE